MLRISEDQNPSILFTPDPSNGHAPKVCLFASEFGSHLLHFIPPPPFFFFFFVFLLRFYLDFPFHRDVSRYQMLCLIFGIWLA